MTLALNYLFVSTKYYIYSQIINRYYYQIVAKIQIIQLTHKLAAMFTVIIQ